MSDDKGAGRLLGKRWKLPQKTGRVRYQEAHLTNTFGRKESAKKDAQFVVDTAQMSLYTLEA